MTHVVVSRARRAACAGALAALVATAVAATTQAATRWIRVAVGPSLPVSDLANEEPGRYLGGQSTGYTAEVGVRVPLAEAFFVRPSLSFHRFGKWHEPMLAVLDTDGELTSLDWTRRTSMGGLRIYFEYIPPPENGFTVFMNGSMGLLYLRQDDDIVFLDGSTQSLLEEVSGAGATAGVGIRVSDAELALAMTFQQPGFEFESPNWFSVDVTLGYTFPSPF